MYIFNIINNTLLIKYYINYIFNVYNNNKKYHVKYTVNTIIFENTKF